MFVWICSKRKDEKNLMQDFQVSGGANTALIRSLDGTSES